MNASFSIENFRCFESLTIEPLARVNIIAGQNNTGKSALLEALWLHGGPNIPDLGLRLAAFRGIQGPDPRRLLHDLFYNFDADRAIVLSAMADWNENPRRLEISTGTCASSEAAFPSAPWAVPGRSAGSGRIPAPRFGNRPELYGRVWPRLRLHGGMERERRRPAQAAPPWAETTIPYPAMTTRRAEIPGIPPAILLGPRLRSGPQEDLARFGEAEVDGFAGGIAECLRALEPRIKRLTTIAAPTPMLYADVGLSRLAPVGFLGEGVGRFLSAILAFYAARDGILLIDEIENGLHHKAMRDVCKIFCRLSRELNVQVYATSQSREFMVAMRDAFDSYEDQDFLIHRVGRYKEEPLATHTYSYEGLDFTLDFGAEVR